MKAIHAIYEHGVFRPLEAVDLPETTEVVFEPCPVLPLATPEARARVLAVLAQRFDSGETRVAARHDEHQP
jgi:predicted DNA-binding antitoxin AbrB/MazE fold protein